MLCFVCQGPAAGEPLPANPQLRTGARGRAARTCRWRVPIPNPIGARSVLAGPGPFSRLKVMRRPLMRRLMHCEPRAGDPGCDRSGCSGIRRLRPPPQGTSRPRLCLAPYFVCLLALSSFLLTYASNVNTTTSGSVVQPRHLYCGALAVAGQFRAECWCHSAALLRGAPRPLSEQGGAPSVVLLWQVVLLAAAPGTVVQWRRALARTPAAAVGVSGLSWAHMCAARHTQPHAQDHSMLV